MNRTECVCVCDGMPLGRFLSTRNNDIYLYNSSVLCMCECGPYARANMFLTFLFILYKKQFVQLVQFVLNHLIYDRYFFHFFFIILFRCVCMSANNVTNVPCSVFLVHAQAQVYYVPI